MFRKMYQGGPSRKQGPRPAIRDADDEPPRKAHVRACEWPSEDFMDRAGIKRRTRAARLQAAAHDAIAGASQYDPNYNFGYPPGHPWQ